jgi:hypothetical protein
VLARRDGSFEPGVALSIRLVIFSSVGCLFFAALPLVLAGLSISGPTLWRISSATFLIMGVAIPIYLIPRRALIQRTMLVPVAGSLNALMVLALIANLIGQPNPPNGGVYLAAVWLVLAIGSVNFIDLMFNRVLGPPAA